MASLEPLRGIDPLGYEEPEQPEQQGSSSQLGTALKTLAALAALGGGAAWAANPRFKGRGRAGRLGQAVGEGLGAYGEAVQARNEEQRTLLAKYQARQAKAAEAEAELARNEAVNRAAWTSRGKSEEAFAALAPGVTQAPPGQFNAALLAPEAGGQTDYSAVNASIYEAALKNPAYSGLPRTMPGQFSGTTPAVLGRYLSQHEKPSVKSDPLAANRAKNQALAASAGVTDVPEEAYSLPPAEFRRQFITDTELDPDYKARSARAKAAFGEDLDYEAFEEQLGGVRGVATMPERAFADAIEAYVRSDGEHVFSAIAEMRGLDEFVDSLAGESTLTSAGETILSADDIAREADRVADSLGLSGSLSPGDQERIRVGVEPIIAEHQEQLRLSTVLENLPAVGDAGQEISEHFGGRVAAALAGGDPKEAAADIREAGEYATFVATRLNDANGIIEAFNAARPRGGPVAAIRKPDVKAWLGSTKDTINGYYREIGSKIGLGEREIRKFEDSRREIDERVTGLVAELGLSSGSPAAAKIRASLNVFSTPEGVGRRADEIAASVKDNAEIKAMINAAISNANSSGYPADWAGRILSEFEDRNMPESDNFAPLSREGWEAMIAAEQNAEVADATRRNAAAVARSEAYSTMSAALTRYITRSEGLVLDAKGWAQYVGDRAVAVTGVGDGVSDAGLFGNLWKEPEEKIRRGLGRAKGTGADPEKLGGLIAMASWFDPLSGWSSLTPSQHTSIDAYADEFDISPEELRTTVKREVERAGEGGPDGLWDIVIEGADRYRLHTERAITEGDLKGAAEHLFGNLQYSVGDVMKILEDYVRAPQRFGGKDDAMDRDTFQAYYAPQVENYLNELKKSQSVQPPSGSGAGIFDAVSGAPGP